MNDVKQTPGAAGFEFTIKRSFNAPVARVWRAWTDPDQLLHWWGPKGFETVSTKVDLTPGGLFHYCLKSPEGRIMWGRFVYREIVPEKRLVFIVSFSDENAGISQHPLHEGWPRQILSEVTFSESVGKTTVTVRWIPYEATKAERDVFEKGAPSMQAGWTGTLDRLEAYLARI
jgi:uncharacterized protein YndB with AHSA1/START domain